MATFYEVPYYSGNNPSMEWLQENSPVFGSVGGYSYGIYTQTENVAVYAAMYDDNGTDTLIVCATDTSSNRIMHAIGAYSGYVTTVNTGVTYSNFKYATYNADGGMTALLPMFDSLNDALAYFDVWIKTPCVDVGNLSGIFEGSTEIKKAYIGSDQVYGKAYAISVTLTNASADAGNPSVAKAGMTTTLNFIFDGASYECPTTAPVVTGATGAWTKNSASSGTMVLTNPTGAISFAVEGTATGVTGKATVSNLGAQDPTDVEFSVASDFPTSFEEWTDPNNIVFIKIPTMYRKINTIADGQITSFTISTSKEDSTYEPYPCFVSNGIVMPYICIAKATAGGIAPIASFRTQARGYGAGYQLFDWQMFRLFQDLGIVIDYALNGTKIDFENGLATRSSFMGFTQLDREVYVDGIGVYRDASQFNRWYFAYAPDKYVNEPTAQTPGYYEASYIGYRGAIKTLGYDSTHQFFNFCSSINGNDYQHYYCDHSYINANAVVTTVIGSANAQFGLYALFADLNWNRNLYGRFAYRPLPQLEAPTNVSVSGTTASFDSVENAESYEFFVDGTTIGTYTPAMPTQSYTVDLSTLSGWSDVTTGSHTLTIKAKASGYRDSEASAGVSFTKAASGYTVTVQQSASSAPSGDTDTEVYDGQDNSGILLGTISSSDYSPHTYTVTSGYIAIVNAVPENKGTTSGGVSYAGPFDSYGWYYSVTADGAILDFSFLCLSGDTLVTMADGSAKRLDEIELGDEVLSMDWATKELISRKVIYTDKDEGKSFGEFDRWIFEDGTEVKTVHRHEFYNDEKGGIAYMDEWNIGDHAYRIDGAKVALVKHETVKEEVRHYKISLEGDTNFFANGLLNGDRNCPKERL